MMEAKSTESITLIFCLFPFYLSLNNDTSLSEWVLDFSFVVGCFAFNFSSPVSSSFVWEVITMATAPHCSDC